MRGGRQTLASTLSTKIGPTVPRGPQRADPSSWILVKLFLDHRELSGFKGRDRDPPPRLGAADQRSVHSVQHRALADAAGADPESDSEFAQRSAARFAEKLASEPGLYGRTVVTISPARPWLILSDSFPEVLAKLGPVGDRTSGHLKDLLQARQRVSSTHGRSLLARLVTGWGRQLSSSRNSRARLITAIRTASLLLGPRCSKWPAS